MSFITELKRRNVFRVAAAYGVIAWLLMQAGDTLAPALNLPDWINSALAFFLILGFPLALFFAWAFELTPEGIKKEKDVDRAQSITHQTGHKLDRTIIVVLILALGYFAYDKWLLKGPDTFSPTDAGSVKVADEEKMYPAPLAKSIAVLPFVNMSEDASNEYFSDGISEEILNALARVKDLKVAGRTSSFAYKGQNQDLRIIGEALGVENILEGSVRKAGNRVRITAQLVKVDDGFHLWSDTYDRDLDDVFAIQDEIAQAILAEMKATLLGDEQVAATQTQTKAYENYLLARQRIYDRTEPSLKMAADLLDEAIEIDPAYAPAHAQRGIATILLSDDNYGTIPDQIAGTRAQEFIDRALELDPQLPDAMAAMGLHYLQYELDYLAAIEILERALAINPNLTNASTWLALSLVAKGDIQGSMRINETVHARDPLHPPTMNNLVVRYNQTGQTDRSLALIESLKGIKGIEPDLLKSEADTRLTLGELADAITLAEQAYQDEPHNRSGRLTLGYAYAQVFDYERALEVGPPQVRIFALHRLGRSEEATLLGMEQAAAGNVFEDFFQVLVENGEYAALIEFVESRWPDLGAFELENTDGLGWGANMMGYIAQSYGHLGREAEFNDAMARFGASLDHQLSQGVNNPYFHASRAFHAMLAGDHEGAINLLEIAFAKGAGFNIHIPGAWPVFAPLNGDPRYEKAKAGLTDYINNERVKLGLEPVTT